MKVTITDNTVEKLELDIGDERCSLIQTTKGAFPDFPNRRVIILNPDEARRVAAHIVNFYKPEMLVKHPDQSLPNSPNSHNFFMVSAEDAYKLAQQDILKAGWVRVIQIGGDK